MIDLRLGRWQDVLADVECDAVICDPPFGERTHAAWREGGAAHKLKREAITYQGLTPDDVHAFVAAIAPRTRGWIVALTSHDLAPAWQDAFAACSRYAFAPLPCVTIGGSIRLAGDGPSNWTVWLMCARPQTRDMQRWGTLPGAYFTPGGQANWREHGTGGGRGKPLDLMRAIVRDYSRPGDLVCDPFAGYGTTARACASLGRRFVGAECDADAYAEAQRRLADVVTVDVQGVQRVRQEALL